MNIKKDFPIFTKNKELIYFDNGATTQKPQQVIDAILNFYINYSAPVHRGIYDLAEQATILYENARKTVAKFIEADQNEIVFTKNTTESINLVAYSWAKNNLKEGDGILVTQMEHHSNLLPWMRLAQEKKLKLDYIPVTPNGELDYVVYEKLLSKNIKFVACVHTSNVLGTTNNIKFIIEKAHKFGAKVLIDAAQSVAHQKISIATLKSDFLVFSGHKMLGPTGIGVLYVTKAMQELMEPYQVGGSMVYTMQDDPIWVKGPRKFEAGTPPIAQAYGLAQAIDYINKYIDFEKLKIHEAELCKYLIEELEKHQSVKILGPIEKLKKSGHLVSFTVKDYHAHDVAAFLNSKNIAVRAGHHCAKPLHQKLGIENSVRVSFYAYNSLEEVKTLITSLREIL